MTKSQRCKICALYSPNPVRKCGTCTFIAPPLPQSLLIVPKNRNMQMADSDGKECRVFAEKVSANP